MRILLYAVYLEILAMISIYLNIDAELEITPHTKIILPAYSN
jgi:hypothetical protein